MDNLNRIHRTPAIKLSKSEKELRMINKNREALEKRDEMIAM